MLTRDGTILRQVNRDGSYNSPSLFDLSNIKSIRILGLPEPIEIEVPEDGIVRIFDRVSLELNSTGKSKRRKHFFGYHSQKCGNLFATVDVETGRLEYKTS